MDSILYEIDPEELELEIREARKNAKAREAYEAFILAGSREKPDDEPGDELCTNLFT